MLQRELDYSVKLKSTNSEQLENKIAALSLIVIGVILIALSILLIVVVRLVSGSSGPFWALLWLGMILTIRGVGISCEKPKTEVESGFMYPLRRKMLFEEYRELTSAVARRGSQYATVESLLISGSLLAVSFVFSNIQFLEKAFVVTTLIASISLVFLAAALDITTTAIDSIFWSRIHQIEKEVEIEVGNRLLYSTEIKGKLWFKLRRIIWPAIFSSLLTFYFYLLFRLIAF